MEINLIRKDPDCGYFGKQLWIPKKHVNARSIKAGLEFPIMGESGLEFKQLWEEDGTHLIVPREFIPRSQYKNAPFPIIDVRPYQYRNINFNNRIVLDFLRPEETIQHRAFKAMCEGQCGILNLSCLSGDTKIGLNRAGKGFSTTIKEAFYKHKDALDREHHPWDLSIPTYIRANKNGRIGLQKILRILYQGKKQTYTLTLQDGKSLRLTDDHGVQVPSGEFVPLSKLKEGMEVLTDTDRVQSARKPKPYYKRHNLEVLLKEKHLGGHRPGAMAFGYGIPTPVKIKSITPHKVEDVYDIMCDDPHHNFVANGIVVTNCGKGKTQIALCHMAHKQVPALVIVNNTTLIDQWTKRIETFMSVDGGVGRVQGDPSEWDWEGRGVVIAMINSLALRHEELPAGFDRYFGDIYYDECFVAGTPIGKTTIDKIKPGETVPSYDEKSGLFVHKKVLGVTRRRAKCLVKLVIEGQPYYCTIPHPFLTAVGWTKAGNLTAGDYVKGTKNDRHISQLHNLSETYSTSDQTQKGPLQTDGQNILLEKVLPGVLPKDMVSSHEQNKSREIRTSLRENEKEQSNVRPEYQKDCTKETECHEPTTTDTGWEWVRRPNGTEDLVQCSSGTAKGLVSGVHSTNGKTEIQRELPDTLQAGHSLSIENDQCGGRREVSRESKGSGQEEGQTTDWFRVDSAEVYEQGSDPKFGEVCSDGYVYNLEVEDTHTYLVDGLIVHNCHHLSAPLFIHTAPMFYGNRWGLTATVNREDGLEPIYQYHVGPVFFRDLSQEVKPRIYIQEVPVSIDHTDPEVQKQIYAGGKINIPKLRTYLGKLESNNNFIAEKLQLPISKKRKVLVLSHSVDQLRLLHAMFPDSGLCTGREKPLARIETLRTKQITFGTLQLVKEALDEKSLDTIFFLTPFGSGAVEDGGKNTLQQGMGRILGYRGGGNHPVVVIMDHVFIHKFHKACRQLKKLINDWPADEGGPLEYTILRPFDKQERYKK